MKNILLAIVFYANLFAVDYGSEIQPIFDSNCTGCHATSSNSYSDHQLDLTSYQGLIAGGESGDVVVSGSSGSSLIWFS